jgi:uroporphyrinogen-III synthase
MVASETQDKATMLAGIGVLITRPAHQAEHLAKLIEAEGGAVIRFPTIEIAPPTDPGPLLAVLDHLADYHLAIFISPNAVDQTFGWLRAAKREWPKRLPIACVGRATAAAVGKQGLNATTPTERFDSEALLGLSLLQDVADKKVVIFRGDGGRELLGNTLKLRGAVVTYAECYRRLQPRGGVEELIDAWRRGEIQIVSVTSSDGLRNLHDMLGETGRGWLQDTPVVVLSQSQAAVCRELGCVAPVLTANEASDEAILEAVKTWRREHFSL